jgi:hypothetical protein
MSAHLTSDTESLDFSYKARSETRDNAYRFRSPKAIRSNRRKATATPGSVRLRRNKHWNW